LGSRAGVIDFLSNGEGDTSHDWVLDVLGEGAVDVEAERVPDLEVFGRIALKVVSAGVNKTPVVRGLGTQDNRTRRVGVTPGWAKDMCPLVLGLKLQKHFHTEPKWQGTYPGCKSCSATGPGALDAVLASLWATHKAMTAGSVWYHYTHTHTHFAQ